MRLALAAIALASVLSFAACVQVSCGCVTPISVFAAASLAPALDELTADFRAAYSAATYFTTSTASSAALRTQIEQGARADVFLSADTDNPQALGNAGLVDGGMQVFATNHLTIVVPSDNPAGITSPVDLARDGVRIIAAGEDVPITKYAEQALANLASQPGYPPDFAAAYETNIVSREDNVGAVTSKIALGEGDAAIVYVTDAKNGGLQQIEIPGAANVTATYGGVVLRDAAGPKAAHAFLDRVSGPYGQAILAKYGFAPAP